MLLPDVREGRIQENKIVKKKGKNKGMVKKREKKVRKKRKITFLVVGLGKDCPHCKRSMQRRKHKDKPKNENYYFTEWDYCQPCGHVQHYDHFKRGLQADVELLDKIFSEVI